MGSCGVQYQGQHRQQAIILALLTETTRMQSTHCGGKSGEDPSTFPILARHKLYRSRAGACAAVVDAGGNICGTTYVNTSIRQRASRSVLVLVLLAGACQSAQ